jgi:hypothetical protein
MKLRLQSNSIRLRLKQNEVQQFAKSGWLEEKVTLGSEFEDVFHYAVETSSTIPSIRVSLKNNGILVQVPAGTVSQWATSDEVAIEAMLSIANQGRLQVLVEKDFACLNGTEEQNADTFPNPLAGTKC